MLICIILSNIIWSAFLTSVLSCTGPSYWFGRMMLCKQQANYHQNEFINCVSVLPCLILFFRWCNLNILSLTFYQVFRTSKFQCHNTQLTLLGSNWPSPNHSPTLCCYYDNYNQQFGLKDNFSLPFPPLSSWQFMVLLNCLVWVTDLQIQCNAIQWNSKC